MMREDGDIGNGMARREIENTLYFILSINIDLIILFPFVSIFGISEEQRKKEQKRRIIQ